MKNRIQNSKFRIQNFLNKRILGLLSILSIASVLRLYKIREYLTFLGDQGRDVLIIKRMIVDGDPTFLGPITSVGSIFLGPLYYYMATPFLFLANFDPVGPAVMIVLFSLATIYLLYRISIEYFSFSVFIFSAFLYATSPLVLIYSRFSWNPNAVPFFSLLYIYSLLKVFVNKKDVWLLISGLCLGVLIQLHYLTLMLFPVVLVVFALRKFQFARKHYFYFIAGFFIPLIPFAAFEVYHRFPNTLTALKFITKREGSRNLDISGFGNHINDVSVRLFWRLVVIKNAEITKVFVVSLFTGLFLWFRKIANNKNLKHQKQAIGLIAAWFVVGLFTFGFYQGTVYDYYFVPLFPIPFILSGIFFSYLWERKTFGKVMSILIVIFFAIFHFQGRLFQYEPNNQVGQTEQIAEFVLNKTNGNPYNFALIADKNSDHAYRYFLEILGDRPIKIETLEIDPARTSVQNQLLVVCEEKICQPLGRPEWQIAGYGRADIDGEWQVGVVKVFRLVPFSDDV